MAAVLALVVLSATLPARAQEQVLDEIVAIVGDQILLRSDIDGLVMGLVQQRRLEYSDALWADALNQLIDQKVMAIHAKRDTTIIVTEDQIDQTLNDRINQLTAQLGSTARIEEIYGKSLVQIRADLREDFRERLLAEQFQSRKIRQIKITPSEVEAWFGQFPTDSLPTLPDIVRVSHIVRYPKVTEAAEQEALEIISAIRNIRGEFNLPPTKPVRTIIHCPDEATMELLRASEAAIRDLAWVEEVEASLPAEKPGSAAAAVAGAVEVFIPLAGLIDLQQEAARLEKDLAKVTSELAKVEKKLANQGFLNKAPDEVKAKVQGQREEFSTRKEKLEANLARVREMG